jgi:hypothetical protein
MTRVRYNLDTQYGRLALQTTLEAVSEHAKAADLWNYGLKLLRCERDGVHTLLGHCIMELSKPDVRAKYPAEQLAQIPANFQAYIAKLEDHMTKAKAQQQSIASKTRGHEFGSCPKRPPAGFSCGRGHFSPGVSARLTWWLGEVGSWRRALPTGGPKRRRRCAACGSLMPNATSSTRTTSTTSTSATPATLTESLGEGD